MDNNIRKVKKFDYIKMINKNKYLYIGLVMITLLSLVFRFIFINFVSDDFESFLNVWYNHFKSFGGFDALKSSPSNYNYPYQYILAFFSYFKVNLLYTLKFISFIFDYIMAIFAALIVYEILKSKTDYVKNKNKYKFIAVITYCLVILIPTVILNSAAWGQCDSIYTSFILISFYFLLKKKSIYSFIFLGLAFSFKLQAVFVLPFYFLIWYKNRDFKLYEFLIIPIIDFIMCIPATFWGVSIKNCILLYFNQANGYDSLVANIPNLYAFFNNINNYSKTIFTILGIAMTFLVLSLIALILFDEFRLKEKIKKEQYIDILILSLMIIIYFLPRMHDRYLYIADVLSIAYFLIKQKNIYVPIIINTVSIHSYFKYLFDFNIIDNRIISVIYILGIIFFTRSLYFDLRKNINELDKNVETQLN